MVEFDHFKQEAGLHTFVISVSDWIEKTNAILCKLVQDVLERFGLFGYRQEWGYEFPLSCFLQLKDVANETEHVIVSERAGEDNLGSEYESVSFECELKILRE